jgi:hypothetical protein
MSEIGRERSGWWFFENVAKNALSRPKERTLREHLPFITIEVTRGMQVIVKRSSL